MGKIASKIVDYTLNSVSIEEFLENISLDMTTEQGMSTAFADAGPRRVTGNYDWKVSMGGSNDFVAGAIDATLFALIASTGVTSAFDPTGVTAGASDPNYDGTVVMESYSIVAATGESVKFSAGLAGNSALTRNV